MNNDNIKKIKRSRGCFPDNEKGQKDYESQWDDEISDNFNILP